MLHAVIMAGGTGTRLWPLSRRTTPKQCLALTGDDTLVQMAVERIGGRVPAEHILVVTNELQVALLREQLPQLPRENIVAEPCGRGSAACIGLGALLIEQKDPNGAMIALPADHAMRPVDHFLAAADVACNVAVQDEKLVIFGIPPRWPSPEFGYIHRGERTADVNGIEVFGVSAFKEKPDPATAQEFVNSGEYYWNSGMFLWTVPTILEAMKTHMPPLHAALCEMRKALGTDRQVAVIAEQYEPLANTTIDYGVMEKADNVEVVEADFYWDDVGTWPAVAQYHEPDAAGNVVIGEAELFDANDCLVRAEDGHLIGIVGADDLVVVHTPDATLVCPRARAGHVRELVDQLKKHGKTKWL